METRIAAAVVEGDGVRDFVPRKRVVEDGWQLSCRLFKMEHKR